MKHAVKIFLVLAVIFILYQVYAGFDTPYVTETVYLTEEDIAIQCEGIVYREESIINAEKTDHVKYYYENGSKVKKGDVVALLYESAKDIANLEKIASIEEEIKLLERCQASADSESAHFDALSRRLRDMQLNYISLVENNKLSPAIELQSEILEMMNKRDIITGKNIDFKKRINELKKEKEKLNNSISQNRKVFSEKSGYFVNTTDGTENVFSLSAAESLTTGKLKKALDKFSKPAENSDEKTNNNAIGKIITKPEWFFAALVPGVYPYEYNEGQQVLLDFFTEGNKNMVSAQIVSMIFNHKEERSLIIFSSNDMNPKVSILRKTQARIISGTKTGISVPKTAVRTRDGHEGVYVRSGNSFRFKKIVPISRNEDYVLCDIIEFDMMLDKGTSGTGEILDFGTTLGIIVQSDSWYSYGEERLGKGREKAREYLDNNPEVMERLISQIKDNDGEYIQKYDDVVIKGKNLEYVQ